MTASVRLLWLIAVSGVAHAQLAAPFEAVLIRQTWSNKWSKIALTADVTATAKVKAPWGVLQTSENGKYWRDGKGFIRQDDEYGMSVLLDLREPNYRTFIDSRLRVIHQEEYPERVSVVNGQILTQRDIENRARDGWTPGDGKASRRGVVLHEIEELFQIPTVIGGLRPAEPQAATVEGFPVLHYKLPYGTGTVEMWVAPDLEFVVASRYVTEAAEVEIRYHNIRLEKPPASLFKLPVEYSIRIFDPRHPHWGDGKNKCSIGARFTEGLTGTGRKKDGFAPNNFMDCIAVKQPIARPAPVPATQPTEPASPQPSGIRPDSIRMDASVTVNGQPVAGLRPQDFVLTVDRNRQPITAVAHDDLPLDIVVVVPRTLRVLSPDDTALRTALGQLLQSAVANVLRVPRPEDRVAFVSYGLEPRLELPLTHDRTAIAAAIRGAAQSLRDADPKEHGEFRVSLASQVRPPAWETAMNIKGLAIDFARHLLSEEPSKGRRKLIFMVTGLNIGQAFLGGGFPLGDIYAGSPDEPVIQRLWDADIVLSSFGMGHRMPLGDQTRRTPVDATYRRNNPMHIANATGGDAIVMEDPQDLDAVLTRARDRYTLWFDQAEGIPAGQERTVKVELSPETKKLYPNAVVHARQGYITR